MSALLLRSIRVWVLFYVLAVINGLLRETVYMPQWGDFVGRIAGTVILALVMLVVMYVFLRRNRESLTRFRLVLVGGTWLGLSLFFEFAVSHWVMEETWELILGHYNVMAGRFRVLIRLVEIAGPLLVGARFLASAPAHEAQPAYEPDQVEQSAPAGETIAEQPRAETAEPVREG